MRGQQRLGLPRHPHPRGGEHDEVVAHPLDVGDQMRGEHDADPVLGDGLHQALQEFPPGERVQAGDRLVEQQQLGPLGDREGQGEPGPLPAGQGAGPLPRVQAELPDPALGQLAVPARVEPAAHAQMAGHGKPRVGRGVLGDEADCAQLRRGAGAFAQNRDRARGRREQPGCQLQERGLAGAVRPDQPDHPAGRDREGAVGQRPAPPVALAQTACLDDGAHAAPSAKQPRTAVR